MKLKSLLLLSGACAILGTSCKKDDNNNNNGGGNNPAPSPSSLTAGQGYLSFTTDKAFDGKTSHTYKTSGTYDKATALLAGGAVTIQGIHTEVSGTTISKVSTAALQVRNAKVGTVNFENTGASFAILVTNGTGGQVTDSYAMDAGTLEITKFSNTEVEGKFSGKGTNDDASTEINITSGTFAGKF